MMYDIKIYMFIISYFIFIMIDVKNICAYNNILIIFIKFDIKYMC